ncbi:MAG: hypothetical protein JWN65_2607 [Solirubrobacterales bacterium]|nr:hypothetical protein [Solirubrobacterales bacterium]
MPVPRRVLRLAAGAVAVAGLALFPAGAGAGVLTAAAPSCEAQVLGQVFLPWLDVANYTLAPGGAAESPAGLTLDGGAGIAPGNEPWQVGGDAGTSSRRLPAGARATTGAICAGLGHPTVRFFSRSSGTGLLSSLRVDALFEDALGGEHSLPIGVVLPHGAWSPGVPMLVVANLLPLLPGDTTPVAFRFTPQGSGTWSVDDVYVDPWRKG